MIGHDPSQDGVTSRYNQSPSNSVALVPNSCHGNDKKSIDDLLVESISRPTSANSRPNSASRPNSSRPNSASRPNGSRPGSSLRTSSLQVVAPQADRPSNVSSQSGSRKQPFLPEIDRHGRMSTQRQGGGPDLAESLRASGKPLLAKTVWSSFSETDTSSTTSQLTGASRDSGTAAPTTAAAPTTPHPPHSGRKPKVKETKRTKSAAD